MRSHIRVAILASLAIYACLLLIYLRRTMPLKFTESNALPMNNDKKIMENLIEEMEISTNDLSDLEKSKTKVIIGEDSKQLLERIFFKADIDRNKALDIRELSKWIHAKVIDHIDRAMRENIGLFTAIDNNPRNGEISWEEYHAHFLQTHGFSDSYISSHDKRHSALARHLKELIMRDRARWSEAARNDPDKLTLDEFLAFTHPESSHRALLQMVEDLFEKFDRDGDEQLTEEEFSDLPSEGVSVDQNLSIPVREERKEEFQHFIDRNKDGKADRSELLTYIDPRNPRHSIQEARHLIELSDTNKDDKLSLTEMLSKTDLFLDSKVVDTEGSFHDEFR